MGKVFILIYFLLSTATTNADALWLDIYKERKGKFTEKQCAQIYRKSSQAFDGYEEMKGRVESNEIRLRAMDCEKRILKKCKDLKDTYKFHKKLMEKNEKEMLNYASVYNSFCK